MQKIRVFLVDDTATVRHFLTDILEEDPEIEVVGTASDGAQGLERLSRVTTDILILDVEMPGMGGIDMLKVLRVKRPELPVLVFSSITERGAMITIEALSNGATDYVTKPAMVGSQQAARDYIRSTLLAKIHTIAERFYPERKPTQDSTTANVISHFRTDSTWKPLPIKTETKVCRIDAVVIGVSMGGPWALSEIFRQLPKDFPLPILIVQHMPAMFTRALAQRLSQHGNIQVDECSEAMPCLPGRAYLAAGNFHLTMERRQHQLWAVPNQDEPVNFCRPSVDVLFESAAEVLGGNVLAVVMTGMGQDGLRGAGKLAEQYAPIVVQDHASSVVWGMAGSVAKAGLATEQVSLAALPETLCRYAHMEFVPQQTGARSH